MSNTVHVSTNSGKGVKSGLVTIQLTDEQIAALTLKDEQDFYGSKRPVIKGPEEAYKYLKHLGALNREHFLVVTLTVRNRAIGRHSLTCGTLDCTIVHPRDVFQVALRDNAAKVIVAHNHPSGDAEPSDDDVVATKRLVTAGKILGIPVMDHIIVGRGSYYSLQENQRM